MEPIHGDKLRGHLETLILATLERGDAHGLEIIHRLEVGGCGLLRLKEGSLYPALYRLETAGQIAGAWETEPHGRRGARRRIYRLTPKGRRSLQRGRGEWQSFVATLGGILGAPASAVVALPLSRRWFPSQRLSHSQ
jgi:DNA-binding PadR family transcriptional regulator